MYHWYLISSSFINISLYLLFIFCNFCLQTESLILCTIRLFDVQHGGWILSSHVWDSRPASHVSQRRGRLYFNLTFHWAIRNWFTSYLGNYQNLIQIDCFIHSFIHSFILSFIHSFIHSFIYYLFIYLYVSVSLISHLFIFHKYFSVSLISLIDISVSLMSLSHWYLLASSFIVISLYRKYLSFIHIL